MRRILALAVSLVVAGAQAAGSPESTIWGDSYRGNFESDFDENAKSWK